MIADFIVIAYFIVIADSIVIADLIVVLYLACSVLFIVIVSASCDMNLTTSVSNLLCSETHELKKS